MPSIDFSPGTLVPTVWLQEVNDFVFSGGGDGENAAQIIANEVSYPGITSTNPNVSTPVFQQFITDCRGKIGFIPEGKYYLNAAIQYDPLYPTKIYGAGWSSDGVDSDGTYLIWTTPVTNGFEIVYEYAQWAPGGGADAHVQYDIANNITPLGNSDNLVEFSAFAVYGCGVANAPGTKTIQLYNPGTESQATGNGFFCYWANNLILKDIWASGWPAAGAKFMWCFGSKVVGGYYVANRSAGIVCNNTNNLFTLDGTKIIGNGMVTGPYVSYNLSVGVEGISPSSYPNLGVSIVNNVDVEGAGGAALTGYGFSQAAGTLTSIVVSGGTATATFSTTPLIAVGDYIGVYGGNIANSTLAINTVRPAIVLTKVGNTITWATTAPNGTYTTGMKIGPYVVGLGLKNCFATEAKIYAEGCTGPAIYVYDDCRGVDLTGSHINDSKIYLDGYYYSVQVSPAGARGTGYAVNDELTLNGGVLAPGGSPTRLKVTAVTGGQIFGLSYVNQGQYLEPPFGTGIAGFISTTTNIGTGSGCVAVSTWFANTAQGVQVGHNQMYGSNGGITAVCHDQVVLEGNQYIPSGPEKPSLDLGIFVRTYAPSLKETGTRIAFGTTLNSGINQYIGPTVPADVTNTAGGIGVLQKLEGANDVSLPYAAKRNTAYGFQAGADVTTGYFNTFVGCGAGQGITTGYTNVLIGDTGGGIISSSGVANFIGIGYGAGGSAADNRIQMGNSSVTNARVQVSWTIVSDQRAKTDITNLDLGTDFILSLTPKSYWRMDENGNAVGDEEFGFLAQDIEATLGARAAGLLQYDEATDTYGLRKDDLLAPMVKMLQELHARITALENP